MLLYPRPPLALFLHGPRMTALEQQNWAKPLSYRDVGILVVHVIIPPPPSIVPTWSQNDSIGATKLSKATVLQRCRYPYCTCYYTPAHPQHCSYMVPEWQHWSNKTEQSHSIQRCRYPCCTCYYTPAHPQHCSYMVPEWQHWSNKTEQSHSLTEM